MLRTCFMIILVFGLVGAMLGRARPSSTPSNHEPIVVQQARDDEAARIAELKAQNTPQFTNQDGAIELQRQPDGHFYADVRINGTYVHMRIGDRHIVEP